MPIHLPDFRDEFLRELTACACVCRTENASLTSLFEGDDILVQAAYLTDDGRPARIRLIVDNRDREHFHFHIDVEKEALEPSRLFKTVEEDEWKAILEPFHGLLVDASIIARFCIPLERLPNRGILRSLFGVSTESCGASLHLTGATMDIESDLFSRVSWQIGGDASLEVNAKLEAESESPVNDAYLTDFVRIMREGLDCFVFESSKEKAEHANQPRTLPQRQLGT